MKSRFLHYRVYFAEFPTSYFSLRERNKARAIRSAQQTACSYGRRKLTVVKVERLLRNGDVKLMS